MLMGLTGTKTLMESGARMASFGAWGLGRGRR